MARAVATSPFESQPLVGHQQTKVTRCTKAKRVWLFVSQIILRDFCSLIRVTGSRIHHIFKSNPYNINPRILKVNQGVAKVVILLNGAGGHRSCNFPMAKALQNAGVENVFNKQVQYYKGDAIPTKDLDAEIIRISQIALKQGNVKVDIGIIAHSLGGMIGAKYIWQCKPPAAVSISMMVSLGSRFRYIDYNQPFAWYNIIPEEGLNLPNDVNPIYDSMKKEPTKAKLLTIWGDRDTLVPKDEALINLDPQNTEVTIKGVGHLGIVNDATARKLAVTWTQKWSQEIA